MEEVDAQLTLDDWDQWINQHDDDDPIMLQQEYIRDKSVQPRILACITTFFQNDVVKRHAWAW